jgi:acyl-CoA reductase-like NAD-dependent aldehyde dehydrogenase
VAGVESPVANSVVDALSAIHRPIATVSVQIATSAIKAGTVWTNTWGVLSDAFEEGGFKSSGIGRSRGVRAMEEFQEVKTQIRAVAPARTA